MYRDTGYPVIDARQRGYINLIFKVTPTKSQSAVDQVASPTTTSKKSIAVKQKNSTL